MVDWLEVIFYASLIAFLGWIVLKIAGIIHSPVWVEMIPYLSISFALGSGFTKIKNMLDRITTDLSELKKDYKKLHNGFIKLKTEHDMIVGNRKHH